MNDGGLVYILEWGGGTIVKSVCDHFKPHRCDAVVAARDQC